MKYFLEVVLMSHRMPKVVRKTASAILLLMYAYRCNGGRDG